MKTRHFLLLALPFILCTNCPDSEERFNVDNCTVDCFILKGSSFDYYDTSRIANVKYTVSAKPNFLGLSTIATKQTDINGNYFINFSALGIIDGGQYIEVGYSHPDYLETRFQSSTTIFPSLDSLDIPITRDLYLVPKAYLSVRVVHSSYPDLSDFSYGFAHKFGTGGPGDVQLNGFTVIEETFEIPPYEKIYFYYNYVVFGNQRGQTLDLLPAQSKGDTIAFEFNLN